MDKINYITQINDFWDFYDVNKDKINTSDITLYFTILRYCNKVNWLNPFTINPYLMAEINSLSINTYYKSLKNLNNLKLIKWEQGKNNKSNAKITILKINNSIVNSAMNSIVNSAMNSGVNSVVNNIKTNKQINLLNNKDFNLILKSKKFVDFLKSKNLEIKKIAKKINIKDYIAGNFPSFNNDEFIKTFDEFLETRKVKKIKTTDYAIKLLIGKLAKLSQNSAEKSVKILEQSIERGWQGVFDIKDENSQFSKKQTNAQKYSQNIDPSKFDKDREYLKQLYGK